MQIVVVSLERYKEKKETARSFYSLQAIVPLRATRVGGHRSKTLLNSKLVIDSAKF